MKVVAEEFLTGPECGLLSEKKEYFFLDISLTNNSTETIVTVLQAEESSLFQFSGRPVQLLAGFPHLLENLEK